MTAFTTITEPTQQIDLQHPHTDKRERSNMAALSGNGSIKSVNKYVSPSFDPACIVNGAALDTVFTAPGPALGDVVLGVALSIDKSGLSVSAAVTAANTITITMLNNSGAAVNLAACTATVLLAKVDAAA